MKVGLIDTTLIICIVNFFLDSFVIGKAKSLLLKSIFRVIETVILVIFLTTTIVYIRNNV
jgi:hypothetical protein